MKKPFAAPKLLARLRPSTTALGILHSVLLLALAGCMRLAGDLEHKDSGAAAPSVNPWAANAGEVARFADEEPFGPASVIAQDRTRIRKSPGDGDVVATLPAGADVMKLASHGGDVLVCFDEPKPGTRHLMGWVTQSALQDPAPPPAPGPDQDDGGVAPPDPPSPPTPPAPHGGGHHHRPHRKQRPQP